MEGRFKGLFSEFYGGIPLQQYLLMVLLLFARFLRLIFESLDETPWYDLSSETSSLILSHGVIRFSVSHKRKLSIFFFI